MLIERERAHGVSFVLEVRRVIVSVGFETDGNLERVVGAIQQRTHNLV